MAFYSNGAVMGVFSKWWENISASTEDIARAELTRQAELIVAEMRSITKDRTGNLDKSIRVEQGPTIRGKPSVFIKAGGPLTTSPDGYDYSRAEEFGTVKELARPFFFVTIRAKKAKALLAVEDRMAQALRSSAGFLFFR